MISQDTRPFSAVIISTLLLLLVGCEGDDTSTSTQASGPSEPAAAATGPVIGEAQAGGDSELVQIQESSTIINSNITNEGQSVSTQVPVTDELPVAIETEPTLGSEVPMISISQVDPTSFHPGIQAEHNPVDWRDYDELTYAWFKNGEQFSITYDEILFEHRKDITRGDSLAVALRLTRDGETVSIISPEFIVLNGPPSVRASLSPEDPDINNPTNRDSLKIDVDINDVDGDDLEVTYFWEGYNNDSATLEGSKEFPENPLVTAYVTVSDGIDQVTKKVTREITAFEELYTNLSENVLSYHYPSTFKVIFRDDKTGELETTMVNGPPDMTYENGWVNWTPSPIFNSTDTFYAHFRTEHGKEGALEFVLKGGELPTNEWAAEIVEFPPHEENIPGCTHVAHNASSSKVFCLEFESSGGGPCGLWCDGASVTRLRVIDPSSGELQVKPLWEHYWSTWKGGSESYNARGDSMFPQFGKAVAMAYLEQSDEILLVDYENRLTLFSTNTGRLIWYSNALLEIEGQIKHIDCPELAKDPSDCSYITRTPIFDNTTSEVVGYEDALAYSTMPRT